MRRLRRLTAQTAIGLAAGAFVAACGQKGPLYLPEKPRDVVTRPAPAPEPAPESSAPKKPDDDEKSEPPP